METGSVTRRDLPELVVANGRVSPVTQVMISPEVASEIIELSVKERPEVKKGDLPSRGGSPRSASGPPLCVGAALFCAEEERAA